jgi:septal ring factor EnvC (AmiA/AmiB activator)
VFHDLPSASPNSSGREGEHEQLKVWKRQQTLHNFPQDGLCLAELQQQKLQSSELRAENAKLVDQCAAAELASAAKARQQEMALRQAQQASASDEPWPAKWCCGMTVNLDDRVQP